MFMIVSLKVDKCANLTYLIIKKKFIIQTDSLSIFNYSGFCLAYTIAHVVLIYYDRKWKLIAKTLNVAEVSKFHSFKKGELKKMFFLGSISGC